MWILIFLFNLTWALYAIAFATSLSGVAMSAVAAVWFWERLRAAWIEWRGTLRGPED